MAEHRARKRFGQNFLHDPGTIEKIVAAIAPEPADRLVEIGPGLGAITRPLLLAHGRIDAIEIDRDVIPLLQERCAGAGELVIHQQDVLTTDFSRFADGGRLRLVGNLPYNISTPLLFHLLDQAAVIHDMHFMLQREVVERICAAPGSGAYGRLTVMLARGFKPEPLFTIGPGAFRPAPKVESAFLRLTPHPAPPFPVGDPARFAEVVARAFGQRRKTLRNALKSLVDAGQFAAADIDPGARAETLSPEDFGRLSCILSGLG
ncbi:MAG TPA: 16S rRNA (adenine(1518)-N(6)/adenine(1519)-N(6))-dimethyltransferase RsmA [Gammaproteobacteria bacterium]|jgi:16S rRNA (adenine1518-N6/adenine1519-N6)-dimethyltransferase|nr:16S rRNA (adenine(1518)-N(6)/adenine(1519)-N(6))-dimethyltransferase RsmA [Gammaproteobacteria bacterium]